MDGNFFPEITSFCKAWICAVKKWNMRRRYWLVRTILCDIQCHVDHNRVNTCRKILFANGATVENIPPTSADLRQHILWAKETVKIYWETKNQTRSISLGIGKSDNKHLRFCSELASACRELTRCSCKTSCRGWCKYFQQELKCTELYSCFW